MLLPLAFRQRHPVFAADALALDFDLHVGLHRLGRCTVAGLVGVQRGGLRGQALPVGPPDGLGQAARLLSSANSSTKARPARIAPELLTLDVASPLPLDFCQAGHP
jgi:hypothetical protein